VEGSLIQGSSVVKLEETADADDHDGFSSSEAEADLGGENPSDGFEGLVVVDDG
jgi:hypothetical protein